MRRITEFDPEATTSGFIDTKIANPCGVLYLFNDSLVSLTLTFPNGDTAQMPPWFYRPFVLETPGRVQWEQAFILTSSDPPISKVYGEVYEKHEAAKLNFSEGPINRHYIGNTVNTNVGTTEIVNEGNAAPSNVVRAIQSGNSSGKNIEMLNSGYFQFAQYISSFKMMLEGVPGTPPNIRLGPTTIVQGYNNAGSVVSNIFGVDGGGSTFLQSHPDGDQVVLYNASGSYILKAIDVHKGLDVATSQVALVGTTSGHVRYYMPFVGPVFKMLIVFFDNYRNASVTEQTLALPVAFTQKALIITNNTKVMTPYNAGSPLVNAVRLATSISGTGFGMNIQSTITSSSLAFITSAFDALGFGTSQAGNTTDIAILAGF